MEIQFSFRSLLTRCLLISFAVTSLVLFSCKSKPAAFPTDMPLPSAVLSFEGIKASDPEHLDLLFSLEINNPLSFSGAAKLASWEAALNGRSAQRAFGLESERVFPITEGSVSFPLMLSMDIAVLAELGLAPADDYDVGLILDLEFSMEARAAFPPALTIQVRGFAEFPGVRPPVFSITSIAILKAELINTRFRVGLNIDNPNPYPVELSALSYELYGNGLLWADGTEKNVFKINGKSALRGNLFLIMNFINMKRDLLDQIINLEDVNYRFAGEALVGTGIDYLPSFRSSFDLAGYSEVLEN